MLKLLIALTLLLSSCATASTRWRDMDTAMEAAFVAGTTMDYMQSIEITRKCQEWNPIVGECGENLHSYFALVLIGHFAVSSMLDHQARTAWQGFTAGIEVHQSWSNWRAGYKVFW